MNGFDPDATKTPLRPVLEPGFDRQTRPAVRSTPCPVGGLCYRDCQLDCWKEANGLVRKKAPR